jgi:hypothetical protein
LAALYHELASGPINSPPVSRRFSGTLCLPVHSDYHMQRYNVQHMELRMIRKVVEQNAPPGSVPSEEYVEPPLTNATARARGCDQV